MNNVSILTTIISAFVLINPLSASAILNGSPVSENEYRTSPVVGIYTIENNSRHRRCAGALLNSTTILTAAHCFLNINNLVVNIIRSTLLNNPVRVQVQISNNQVFLHPGYSTDEYINDFAIIKLNQKLDATDEVLYPKFTESLDFEQFIFFGYGRDQNKKLDLSTFQWVIPWFDPAEHLV